MRRRSGILAVAPLAAPLAAVHAADPRAAAASSVEGGGRSVRAIRAGDCAMTGGEAAAIPPGLGHTTRQTRGCVAFLAARETVTAEETATFDDDRQHLSPELCAPDPAGEAALLTKMN